MAGQAGIFRPQFGRERGQANRSHITGAFDRQFVQPFGSGDDQRGLGAEQFHRVLVKRDQRGLGDADQLARDPGRIGQRAAEIEDRPAAQRLADRADAGQRRMVGLGEQEGDPEVRQGLFGQFRCAGQVKAQGF